MSAFCAAIRRTADLIRVLTAARDCAHTPYRLVENTTDWSSNSLVGSMPAAAVNSPIDIVFEAARSAEDECDLMVAAVVAAAMRATPINPVIVRCLIIGNLRSQPQWTWVPEFLQRFKQRRTDIESKNQRGCTRPHDACERPVPRARERRDFGECLPWTEELKACCSIAARSRSEGICGSVSAIKGAKSSLCAFCKR